jgi:hypothetical protein
MSDVHIRQQIPSVALYDPLALLLLIFWDASASLFEDSRVVT